MTSITDTLHEVFCSRRWTLCPMACRSSTAGSKTPCCERRPSRRRRFGRLSAAAQCSARDEPVLSTLLGGGRRVLAGRRWHCRSRDRRHDGPVAWRWRTAAAAGAAGSAGTTGVAAAAGAAGAVAARSWGGRFLTMLRGILRAVPGMILVTVGIETLNLIVSNWEAVQAISGPLGGFPTGRSSVGRWRGQGLGRDRSPGGPVAAQTGNDARVLAGERA